MKASNITIALIGSVLTLGAVLFVGFGGVGEKHFNQYLYDHKCELRVDLGKPVYFGNPANIAEASPKFTRMYTCNGGALILMVP